MSRRNNIPLKSLEIARIEAEARRMRAEFFAAAFTRLFARLRGEAALPAHPARA